MKEIDEKVKSMLQNKPLTRQQRRQMERSGKKYERKTTFSKQEVEKANSAAYEYGKQLTLKAAKEVLGLGHARLERVEKRLAELEFETFIKPFETIENKGE